MNDNKTLNFELEPSEGPEATQDTGGGEVATPCACPHRGFRIALYTLVAFALLGSVAARAAPEMTGSVTDFVQTQVFGFMGAPQSCSGPTGSCCQSTFVYEGSTGLPCCGAMECTVESPETDSADPPPPTDLSEPSDFSGDSEPEEAGELPTLDNETGELEIGVQR